MIANIMTFCELFYKSTLIPIIYYDRETERSTLFPKKSNIDSIIRNKLDGFYHFKKNPDFFISNSYCYFGFIASNNNDYFLILGPVFELPITDTMIHDFMHEFAILPEHKENVSNFLRSIPQISSAQFLQNLTYLHYCINEEVINPAIHFETAKKRNIEDLSATHTERMFDIKENQTYHNSYHFERQMLQYIQDGEVDKLQEFLLTEDSISTGIIADNALREEKNLFIVLATLVPRSAILGGMDIEQAYQLADVYIQDCEKSQDIAYISTLSYTMIIDFTERVASNKIPGGMSNEVFDCMQFINKHINEPIQVGDVAEYVGKSRSYLTKKFKEELGFDISSFIMRCRLEEAKSLLTYSEKSLSEISNYLCFSTQAYFQNMFKKKYGITPNQYRNTSRRIR